MSKHVLKDHGVSYGDDWYSPKMPNGEIGNFRYIMLVKSYRTKCGFINSVNARIKTPMEQILFDDKVIVRGNGTAICNGSVLSEYFVNWLNDNDIKYGVHRYIENINANCVYFHRLKDLLAFYKEACSYL